MRDKQNVSDHIGMIRMTSVSQGARAAGAERS